MTKDPNKTKCSDTWQAIDPILQALCRFEQNQDDPPDIPRHFAIRQTWMANDRYLPRLFLHLITFSKPSIPGLFLKHILGLLAARFKMSGKYPKILSKAAAVQLKLNGHRLRAFFLPSSDYPEGLCLKIIPKKEGIDSKTRDELAFRKHLEKLGCITLPHIKSVEEDDDFLYIAEELIQGQRYRHRQHKSLFIDQGIPELYAMYEAAGVHYTPLDVFYPLPLLNDTKRILGDVSKETDFQKMLSEAFRKNPDIPIGACHNDLLPSNLCVSKNKLYFFDWEMVSEGPIFADLLRLPFKYDSNDSLIGAIATTLKEKFPAPSNAYLLHFTAYIAERIVKNPAKKERFLEHWKRHHQKFAD